VLEKTTIATAVLVSLIYRMLVLVVEESATFQGDVT
jgi:hypothetical protein